MWWKIGGRHPNGFDATSDNMYRFAVLDFRLLWRQRNLGVVVSFVRIKCSLHIFAWETSSVRTKCILISYACVLYFRNNQTKLKNKMSLLWPLCAVSEPSRNKNNPEGGGANPSCCLVGERAVFTRRVSGNAATTHTGRQSNIVPQVAVFNSFCSRVTVSQWVPSASSGVFACHQILAKYETHKHGDKEKIPFATSGIVSCRQMTKWHSNWFSNINLFHDVARLFFEWLALFLELLYEPCIESLTLFKQFSKDTPILAHTKIFPSLHARIQIACALGYPHAGCFWTGFLQRSLDTGCAMHRRKLNDVLVMINSKARSLHGAQIFWEKLTRRFILNCSLHCSAEAPPAVNTGKFEHHGAVGSVGAGNSNDTAPFRWTSISATNLFTCRHDQWVSFLGYLPEVWIVLQEAYTNIVTCCVNAPGKIPVPSEEEIHPFGEQMISAKISRPDQFVSLDASFADSDRSCRDGCRPPLFLRPSRPSVPAPPPPVPSPTCAWSPALTSGPSWDNGTSRPIPTVNRSLPACFDKNFALTFVANKGLHFSEGVLQEWQTETKRTTLPDKNCRLRKL